MNTQKTNGKKTEGNTWKQMDINRSKIKTKGKKLYKQNNMDYIENYTLSLQTLT